MSKNIIPFFCILIFKALNIVEPSMGIADMFMWNERGIMFKHCKIICGGVFECERVEKAHAFC